MLTEKFRRKGMPDHCGVCNKFNECSVHDPQKFCLWLRASKQILARFKGIGLILGFLFFSSTAFAALPTLGTISPTSGSTTPEVAKLFTAKYSDADGWANIKEACLLVSTAPTTLTNSVYLYYDQNTNLLYLRNDANTTWLGGYAPGSANIVENARVKLNCASTTITGSGTTLTVKWNITFKSAYSGKTYNTYLSVKDDIGGAVALTKKGTYTVNFPPTVETISPSFGASIPDQTFYFATIASDPDGWQNIQYIYFLINTTTATASCFDGYYNQNTNKLYLRNDAGTGWVGGYAPGSSYTIQNSYAKLSCALTTVSGAGTTLSVKWAVTFKPTFLGTKNTYLYVRDDVNAIKTWTQKGSWIALDRGVVIGPQGGELLSSDGKVSLNIPQGALNDPTAISITSITNESLEGATPTGKSLLSVVDCKPYGLVFNIPIEITYTLNQAEIPGTAVELGLYDSVQKKILSTGQTSVVASDGYSVTFSLSHFSTYAALKNLTPQGAPIGGGVKIPLPDMFTGAFGHSIPIAVPPGRKGIQPSLGLSYRSSNSNSWVGLGFSLNPGYIVRSTRLGPPTYIDTQDTFYLITDAGTTELVHLVDNLYQAKIESSFTKFFKESDDSWRVVAKDGSVLRFGQTADSRETSLQGTYSWALTKAIDTNGNYIEYSYVKDQGKTYLAHIDYTGNEIGIAPTNSVEFFLESRSDVASSYISTSKIAVAKRLKEIQVKVNSSLVWRYVLEYAASTDTDRSLLTRITQYSSDNKNLPVQSFTYQRSH